MAKWIIVLTKNASDLLRLETGVAALIHILDMFFFL